MPLTHQEKLIGTSAQCALWRIEEPEEWFLQQLQLSPVEHAELESIKGWRRMEWLAVRQLVAELVPGAGRSVLVKDEHGKPHLHNSSLHVSISHSHHLAAAMVGETIVGIDIQKIVEKIGRLAPRFLSAAELDFIPPVQHRIEQLHVCWCAKEALYKAYGKREIDFCVHLLLDPFVYSPSGGEFKGRVIKGDFVAEFELRYVLVEGCMLVTAVTPILRANSLPFVADWPVQT
ncbi:4'-phosphopantetheinyl transferase family protein [Haliscomenobacter hydrossis]|uniref:4'-phosphopantetheinyl transferase n=1 Tax=Haliscomenobacter hydrossis (strain ATCC 27775 / DSM 1100 / LMG 10767 / O) TaxID=760192 RepID=F4KU97_HALH1|nr:4'-phosphopantetheinyl transferase superfamily protein [Haliscomenobacter hydrossis]AEE50194.1 4'-phosphopantetheinyl transferase [Haliscomenobacter hydrossis DSM 1100]